MRIVLSLIILFSLSSCSLKPIEKKEISQYTIIEKNTSKPKVSNTINQKLTIYLLPTSANAPYNSKEIYYKTSPFKIEKYNYSKWIVSPSILFNQILVEKLSLHEYVANEYNEINQSKFIISTNIVQLLQDLTKENSKCTLSIRVKLVKPKSNILFKNKKLCKVKKQKR